MHFGEKICGRMTAARVPEHVHRVRLIFPYFIFFCYPSSLPFVSIYFTISFSYCLQSTSLFPRVPSVTFSLAVYLYSSCDSVIKENEQRKQNDRNQVQTRHRIFKFQTKNTCVCLYFYVIQNHNCDIRTAVYVDIQISFAAF